MGRSEMPLVAAGSRCQRTGPPLSPPPALIGFYQSHRACVRARLAAWHARDPGRYPAERWRALARDYLERAKGYLEAA